MPWRATAETPCVRGDASGQVGRPAPARRAAPRGRRRRRSGAGSSCRRRRSIASGACAHRRQQAELGHLHRHRVVLGLVAEAAGHAAARALDQLRLRRRESAAAPRAPAGPRRTPSGGSGRARSIGCVAGCSAGAKRPARGFAGDELLEQQRLRRRPSARASPRPITSISSRSVSRHDGSRPTMAMPRSAKGSSASSSVARLRLCRVGHAGGEQGAAAAELAAAACAGTCTA